MFFTMDANILNEQVRAFNCLFDAVVVTDLRGIVTDWNKGAETLYGYSKDEILGEPVSVLHAPEKSTPTTSEIISTVKRNGKWFGEMRMLHKDGRVGWVESMSVPIFDNAKKMIGVFSVNRDITDRINEIQRLSYLAHYDQLTNIPNRYLLIDRISHLIAQSKRNNSTFSIFYIDLDEFKNINDAKGHTFGDKVLVETALRLKQSIRNSDTVARIGGDEFVLLLENTSGKDDISAMAETIIQKISRPLSIDGEALKVSCSIGVATYPAINESIDVLLAAADRVMYKAKSNGRGTYEISNPHSGFIEMTT